MANLTIRRRQTPQQRALRAASKAGSAALTYAKARIAWLAGKKAARVAAPAVVVGTAAVVVKKRSGGHEEHDHAATNGSAPTPVSVAPAG
ncbi:hypothetical protein FSW04_00885 [Baekduia soli]|uniref:Uncharacterized protein n=1 Tax=Baekduia soli TaxID=496014 RepID=A0A5B8TZW8_9ACTN|nr:hypothetical protein [Baekduia soli]QEC46271.1 hypothetical protein FSW04_00885 [Baekduia soli]